MQALLPKSGVLVASKVILADTPKTRAQGLLGRYEMPTGEALWIVPCSMIHTFFMQFPIDVLFLDRQLKVVRVLENLKPWRISPWIWGAHSVLELAAGSLKGSVIPGDILKIR